MSKATNTAISHSSPVRRGKVLLILVHTAMVSVGLQSLDEKVLPSLGINTAMKTGRRRLVSPSLSQSCNSNGDGVRVVLAETRTRYKKACCANSVRGTAGTKSNMVTVERQAAADAELTGIRLALNRHTLSSRSRLASAVHMRPSTRASSLNRRFRS